MGMNPNLLVFFVDKDDPDNKLPGPWQTVTAIPSVGQGILFGGVFYTVIAVVWDAAHWFSVTIYVSKGA